jgi:hypothetical protein
MQGKIPLPDEQPVAVNALRNKRAQIAGMIAMHEGEARQLRAELIHIDAVLRLFDPETDPEGLPISKAFPRRMAYFAKGEVSRRVYDALREGTTAANELAEAAMTEKGISEDDRHVRRDFVNRFHNMLHHMRRRGQTEKIGNRKGVRWKLAPREPDLI